ncbi:MAG: hypothetical protein JNL28_12490 [Planctomycetes bacterium]|nr:hypothetical protein [Planctomycetota bacterium]
MNLRAHGFTLFFWAALAAWAVVLAWGFEAQSFEDRVVSNATLHAVDIGARARLYFAAVGAFLATGALVGLVLRLLERALAAEALRHIENASFVGVILVALAGVTSMQTDAVRLCVALQLAYVACALLDVRAFAGGTSTGRGFLFLLIAAGAYGLVVLTPWATNPWATALTTAVLFALARALEPVAGGRIFDRVVGVLAALSSVPLALIVREEIVLVAHQRGHAGVTHAHATWICAALIAAGAWLLCRRSRVGTRAVPERLVTRVSFPLLIIALTLLAGWTAARAPLNEMLESGNAGVTLQQWYEFGRWPFFETLDVHGLSDCFMGFLYSCANGWNGIAWQHWDMVPYAFIHVAVYALLARLLGNAPLAFVLVVASPFVRALFPPEAAMGVVFLFVALWSTRAGTGRAAAWTAAAWIALALWRVDLAFAAGIALVGVWVVTCIIDRARPAGWKRAPLAFVIVVATAAAAACVMALALGVDPLGRLREFARIAASDTAFGRARMFDVLEPAVVWRTFVMPLVTIAALVALIWKARSEGEAGRARRWATLALVFLGLFSLALFTRGLVRHTFVEHDATFVTAFQFAVVALSPLVLLRSEQRVAATALFATLHVLLPLAFDVGAPGSSTLAWRANPLTRASIRVRNWQPVAEGVDRSPVSDEFRAHNIEPMRALARGVLAEGETFVDLSGSPMLYVYSGVRTPHWANHLIVLQGDELQKRCLAELESARAPLFVLSQEFDLAARDGMIADVEIDKVPLALWHARIFDAVHARAEPFTLAGRWIVWSRADWAPAVAWGPEPDLLGEMSVGTSAPERAFDVPAGATFTLAAEGSAASAGRLRVTLLTENASFSDLIERDIEWPAGATRRYVDVPGEGGALRVTVRACTAAGGLSLTALRAEMRVDPARAEAALRTARVIDTELGATARLWGKYDAVPRVSRSVLHAASVEACAIQAGGVQRFAFQPLPRAERSVLIEAEITNTSAPGSAVRVSYGVGEVVSGSFRLTLGAQGERAAYVLRPGMQPNWHRRPNSWVEIESVGGDLFVHSLRFLNDD